MKQEIKDKELQERQAYASPKVKVIEVASHSIMHISPMDGTQNEGYEEGSTDGWYY